MELDGTQIRILPEKYDKAGFITSRDSDKDGGFIYLYKSYNQPTYQELELIKVFHNKTVSNEKLINAIEGFKPKGVTV